MITAENDYEPIIYEQPVTSHKYENHLELLHNYYIGPINNTQTTQEGNKINTVINPDKKDETQCLNTKHFYQNIRKKTTKNKNLNNSFSLREPKKQRISTTRS